MGKLWHKMGLFLIVVIYWGWFGDTGGEAVIAARFAVECRLEGFNNLVALLNFGYLGIEIIANGIEGGAQVLEFGGKFGFIDVKGHDLLVVLLN